MELMLLFGALERGNFQIISVILESCSSERMGFLLGARENSKELML
jgi:hypothetical protein